MLDKEGEGRQRRFLSFLGLFCYANIFLPLVRASIPIGANILARFALAHPEKCLGLCLIHCTSTTAGFMEVARDSILTWKLDHIGMDPSVESYLVLHRFGSTNLEGAHA